MPWLKLMFLHAWYSNFLHFTTWRTTDCSVIDFLWLSTGNILHKLFFGLSKNQQITYEIPLYDQVPSYIFFSLADVGTLSKSLRKTTFEYFWLARACPGLLMMSLSILIILHTQPCHAWYYALTAGVVMEKWIHTYIVYNPDLVLQTL